MGLHMHPELRSCPESLPAKALFACKRTFRVGQMSPRMGLQVRLTKVGFAAFRAFEWSLKGDNEIRMPQSGWMIANFVPLLCVIEYAP